MQEVRNMETMISKDYKPETEEVVQFIENLDQNGKEKFLEFIRGARFALSLQTEKQAM